MTTNNWGGLLGTAVGLAVLGKVTFDLSDELIGRKSKRRKVKQNTYGDWW